MTLNKPTLTPTSHQPDFADTPTASDDWLRGNLDGDVRIAREPVYDPIIMMCALRSGPKLSPAHETAYLGLCAHFTPDDDWIMVDQAAIAREAGLHRTRIPRLLRDIASIFKIASEPVSGQDGARGLHRKYRLAAKDRNFEILPFTEEKRFTVDSFHAAQLVAQLETHLADTQAELRRILEKYVPADSDDFHTATTTMEINKEIPLFINPSVVAPAVTENLNSGLERKPSKPASEDQLNMLATLCDKKGLPESQIFHAWQTILPGITPPPSSHINHLTNYQANQAIKWLRTQPDAKVPDTGPHSDSTPPALSDEFRAAMQQTYCDDDTDLILDAFLARKTTASFDPSRLEPAAEAWIQTAISHRGRNPRDYTDRWDQCTCHQVELAQAQPEPLASATWAKALPALRAQARDTEASHFTESAGITIDADGALHVRIATDSSAAWMDHSYQGILAALKAAAPGITDVYFYSHLHRCQLHPEGGR